MLTVVPRLNPLAPTKISFTFLTIFMETAGAYEPQMPEHNTSTAIKELDDGGQSTSLIAFVSTPPNTCSNFGPIKSFSTMPLQELSIPEILSLLASTFAIAGEVLRPHSFLA